MLTILEEREPFHEFHPCEYHKANPGKQWAGCTCRGTFGTRPKRTPPSLPSPPALLPTIPWVTRVDTHLPGEGQQDCGRV